MFCASYLHACDSRVRLMPTEMECDIFAHTDTESAPVIHWVRHIKRKREKERERERALQTGLFTSQRCFQCVFVRLDAANATKPSQKDVCPALCRNLTAFRGGSQNSGISHHYQTFSQMRSLFFSSSLCTHVPSSLTSFFHPFFFPHCHPLSCLSSCTPKFLPFPHYFYTNPPLKSTSASDPVSHA